MRELDLRPAKGFACDRKISFPSATASASVSRARLRWGHDDAVTLLADMKSRRLRSQVQKPDPDVSSEIAQILSRKVSASPCKDVPALVISPPKRTCNPIIRDSRFSHMRDIGADVPARSDPCKASVKMTSSPKIRVEGFLAPAPPSRVAQVSCTNSDITQCRIFTKVA